MYNTTYGNAHITDGTNQLTVYGLNQNGTRYDAMTVKPIAGDTITVYGIIGTYNNAAQFGSNNIKNELTNHVAHTCVPGAEATCTTAQTCTICEKVLVEALDHELDANGACTREGCDYVKPAGVTVTTANFDTGSDSNSYTATLTTKDGWTVNNARSDEQSAFGSSNEQLCLTGNKNAVGKLTSTTLSGGISALSVEYGYAFSESNGVSLKINIKDTDGNVLATTDIVNKTLAKGVGDKYTWELAQHIEGDFVIEIINNSPSGKTDNKDRFSIWNLQWTSAPAQA